MQVFFGWQRKAGIVRELPQQKKNQDSSGTVMRVVFGLVTAGIIIAFIETYVSIAFPGNQDMSIGIASAHFCRLCSPRNLCDENKIILEIGCERKIG